MEKRCFLIPAAILCLVMTGCAKKDGGKESRKQGASLNQTVIPEELQTITIIPSQDNGFPPEPVLSDKEEKLSRNRQIQEALKKAGYYRDKIDGLIGAKTRKAIREFQTANGLTVDGKVGPKTWAELEKVLANGQN